MTATDELGKHEQRIGEAQRRVQALGRDVAELAAKVSALKEERINAYADEDERNASQLSKKIADAQARQAQLAERRAGAELAVRRATGEHQAFVVERYPDLIGEIQPQAREAAKRIDDLSDQLLAALQAWEATKSQVTALAHAAGQTAHVPGLGWDELSRDLRRRPRPTKAPLPRQLGTIAIPPEHDPDPAIRETARSEIRETAGGGPG
jgi:chromosome segregation ATPase